MKWEFNQSIRRKNGVTVKEVGVFVMEEAAAAAAASRWPKTKLSKEEEEEEEEVGVIDW